jgi:hypothetical protein
VQYISSLDVRAESPHIISQGVSEKRDIKWSFNKTIMIDLFKRRERHIYLKPMSESDTAPIMREFGPQNEDHLLDQKNFQQLEKILPVLNGLVYLKKGNLFLLNKSAKT